MALVLPFKAFVRLHEKTNTKIQAKQEAIANPAYEELTTLVVVAAGGRRDMICTTPHCGCSRLPLLHRDEATKERTPEYKSKHPPPPLHLYRNPVKTNGPPVQRSAFDSSKTAMEDC